MSQDLFAAFGENDAISLPASKDTSPEVFDATPVIDEDEDDFGDFEDASKTLEAELPAERSKPSRSYALQEPIVRRSPTKTIPTSKWQPAESHAQGEGSSRPEASARLPSNQSLPPKQAAGLPFKPKPATQDRNATGSHPFAGHMDLLFSAGDDEYDAGADDLNLDLANDPEAAMAYSKQLIAAQMADAERQSHAIVRVPQAKVVSMKIPRSPIKLRKKSQYAPPKDHSMFFDAENISEEDAKNEDDWGDFETIPADISAARVLGPPKGSTQSMPAIDLIGLDDINGSLSKPQSTRSAASALNRSVNAVVAPETDLWDDFEGATPLPVQVISHGVSKMTPQTTIPPTTNLKSPIVNPNVNSLPPKNIPPPALLISIFPSIIASAQDNLFSTLAKLAPKDKEEMAAHPATHQFLQSYISAITALAHILAGRRMRWKRDQILAQSMRIGPASAGGKSGGMKLAVVDKSEIAKEDREVLDTVRAWNEQVGKVRSAVNAVNTASRDLSTLPHVPGIAEQMPVRTLKPVEGGFTAPLACAICGLRREERVVKVDEGVEDSFGEWWVQDMNMHMVCRKFWEDYHEKLKSR